MPARKATTIRNKTITHMKSLGTYKPEYDNVISIYADLCEQYEQLTKTFKTNKYECESPTESGGTKKAAIVGTLENLRKDILQYSDRLCLNPKALETVTIEKPSKSKLAAALEGIEMT